MTATGGETRADPSGWTVDTLHVYLTEMVEQLDRRISDLRTADKEAIATALTATERRFDSVNEFRGQLTDQAATFVGRAEHEAKYIALTERFDRADRLTAANTNRLTTIESRSGGLKDGWGYLVGAVGLASLVVSLILALTS